MDELLYLELSQELDAGQQWCCQLLFPVFDLDGVESRIDLCSYMHKDFCSDVMLSEVSSTFPSNSAFQFMSEV
jgi:hypothetical protein